LLGRPHAVRSMAAAMRISVNFTMIVGWLTQSTTLRFLFCRARFSRPHSGNLYFSLTICANGLSSAHGKQAVDFGFPQH
jgi:hypothetical protein